MAGPRTPPEPSFAIVPAGPRFSELPEEEQVRLVRLVDEHIRPAVLDLGVALSGTAPALRAARNGLRAQVAALADGEVIPLVSKTFKGASDLTKEDLLRVLDAMALARKTQFTEADQDLFARVCGPRFDSGGG